MSQDERLLKERYEAIALTGDVATTACDYQLRELEIDFGLQHIRDGDRVLDVGCGPAALMRLLPPNVHYYGIDIAISNPAPNLIEADILHTPISFGGQKFDIVSAQGVFEYLGDFQLEKFAEIADILKSDGKFLVTYWNFDHRKAYVHKAFSHVQRLTDFRSTLEQYFSVDRCIPVAHNWEHSSPNKPFLRAVNMNINVCIPLISSLLVVEYFFICSRKTTPART